MKEDKLGNKARLQHIILASQEISSYTKGATFEDFAKNSMMLNATIRQLEIIGEAANRLSSDVLEQHAEIEWAKIIGLRNLLIHEYFGVNPKIVWAVVQHNLPVFEQQILTILKQYEQ